MRIFKQDGNYIGEFRISVCGHPPLQHFATGYPDGAYRHSDVEDDQTGYMIIPKREERCQCKNFVPMKDLVNIQRNLTDRVR
jgi:hypothetical protein